MSIRMRCVVVLLAVVAAVPLGSAQQLEPEVGPMFDGQWFGPLYLGGLINPAHSPVKWAEIVHMTTLPPPNADRVLLWCRRMGWVFPEANCPPGVLIPQGPGETWMWDARQPNFLSTIQVPNNWSGSQDIFCGAQLPLHDGRLITASGTDMPVFVTGDILGIEEVFLFDNAAGSPGWSAVSASLSQPLWYASALQLPDRRIVVIGDTKLTGSGTGTPVIDDTNQKTRHMGTLTTAVPTTISWDYREGSSGFRVGARTGRCVHGRPL